MAGYELAARISAGYLTWASACGRFANGLGTNPALCRATANRCCCQWAATRRSTASRNGLDLTKRAGNCTLAAGGHASGHYTSGTTEHSRQPAARHSVYL